MIKKNKFNISDVSIIIPVKNNQTGINALIDSIIESQEEINFPKEIIIVDNNSKPPIVLPANLKNKKLNVQIIVCKKKGPASARNFGAKVAKGEWLYFTDSDCVVTDHSLLAFQKFQNEADVYAGKIVPLEKGIISNFYENIKLLNPEFNEKNESRYLISANCLIKKSVFVNVNGFNEKFEFASGEDIDLGIRISKKNKILYINEAIVFHNYNDNLIKMYKRFYRYGKSIKQIESLHNLKIVIDKLFPKSRKNLTNYILQMIAKIALKHAVLSSKYKG